MRLRQTIRLLAGALVLTGVALPAAAQTPTMATPAGAVYTMTNAPEGNAVVAFARGTDGALTKLGMFPTGGNGTGVKRLPKMEADNGIDPLVSNASLVLSCNGRMLFAVNAGSNTVTCFQVRPDATLAAVGVTPTGGTAPNGVAMHGDLVYIANAGSPAKGEAASLTGFRCDPNGRLVAMAQSARPLSSAKAHPAHALFSPKGDFLLVTEIMTDKISVYRVGPTGLLSAPASTDAAKDSFGMCFTGPYRFVVTEAQGGAKMGGTGKASVSSCILSTEGAITPVSKSVGNNQTAACWAQVSCDGRFVYSSNTDSGNISCYTHNAEDGSIKLGKEVAAMMKPEKGETSGPIDSAMSRDGKFFYQLYSANGAVVGYRVEKNGDLTPMDKGTMMMSMGLPMAAGFQGLAAW